jgi:DNA-binding PadR family transcriptional regulator
MGASSSADRFLPLRPDVFDILLALHERDLHGYALIKAARDADGHPGQRQPGALYRLLRRLLDDGLVREVDAPDDADPRRRYYQITPAGRLVARAEAARLAQVVARSRRGGLIGKATAR